MLSERIYLLLGQPCSGKTTIAALLAERHGMARLSGDERRFDFMRMADPRRHPWMTRKMTDFFSRPAEELIEWERGVIAEQTPMALRELEALAQTRERVLFEGMLDLEQVAGLTRPDRIAYLTVNRAIREREFYARADHAPMLQSILDTPGLSQAERERRIALRRQVAIDFCPEDASRYGVAQIERAENSALGERLARVEAHFGLRG